MKTFEITQQDFKTVIEKDKTIKIIKKNVFDGFNEDILNLGKIDAKSNRIGALSVIFDLEGFTNFCKQIDPQLAVPEYLSEFLKWIFSEIRNELIAETFDEGYTMWTDLPFLSKYLGDGILFLWKTENMTESKITNVIACMYNICAHYTDVFLPKISQNVVSPPTKLRCGIARGDVYSVGDGNDFVGPCINMSARLQKLYSLSFCFNKRGINFNTFTTENKKLLITKKVDIRGIGSDELVCMLKNDFNSLPDLDKENFRDI